MLATDLHGRGGKAVQRKYAADRRAFIKFSDQQVVTIGFANAGLHGGEAHACNRVGESGVKGGVGNWHRESRVKI